VKANKAITVLLFSFLVAAVVFGTVGCSSGNEENEVPGMEIIEVREYQGEDLSSINQFRENSIAGPQYVDVKTYKLNITGLVDKPLALTYDEVINQNSSAQKVVTLDCVEGWSVTILWEGIPLKGVFDAIGIQPEANTVIFRSYDGYSTSLPLSYIMDNNIILAYKINGVTLPPERGFPFQVVAESKWGYKWAKWVTEIELSDDPNFKGYWEQRGYSNDGSLDQEFFEFNP
jgi:DMSO/TMAO reductase YedYZ molybdopterin-dependent catalytic subunit